MSAAQIIECSPSTGDVSRGERLGAIFFLVFMAVTCAHRGVELLVQLDERAERRFPTGYEVWDPWLGVALLCAAVVAAVGAAILTRSYRRDARAPLPSIAERAGLHRTRRD